MELAAGEFVRLHDGDDFFDAVQGGQMILVEVPLFADGADDGAELALGEMGLGAHAFDLSDDTVDGRLLGVWIHNDDQFQLRERVKGDDFSRWRGFLNSVGGHPS